MRLYLVMLLCAVICVKGHKNLELELKCEKTPANDVQAFPSCTFEEAWDNALQCVGILVEGYPYPDRASCKKKLDRTVACLTSATSLCLSGLCPMVFDDPIGYVRALYAKIRDQVKHVQTMRGFLQTFHLNDQDVKTVYKNLCPIEGMESSLLEFIKETSIIKLEFCSKNEIMKEALVKMLTAFYKANSHAEFCKDFAEFRETMSSWVNSHCTDKALRKMLHDLWIIPLEELQHLTPNGEGVLKAAKSGLDAVIKIVNLMKHKIGKIEVPGCKAL